MDQLEKIISEYRNEIQNDQPHQGHFDRFEMKMNAFHKRKTNYRLIYALSIAAVVIVALMIFHPVQPKPQRMTLSDLSPQYADVEFYYTSTITKQANKLNRINSDKKDNLSIKILIDEIEAYDKIFEQLCTDLNATPNDDRVINALITYYQTKLEIINKILNEFENKQEKIKNHENINI